jgi:hypothetical protein
MEGLIAAISCGARRCLTRMASALVFAGLAGCGGDAPPTPGGPSQVDWQLTGVVRESGTQTPVPDARVCWTYPNCVTTGEDGSYRILRSDPRVDCPFVSAPGFEGRQDCITLSARTTTWDPTIQRIIRIEAGETVAATISPDDISGLQFEDYCVACKRIRIVAARAGNVTVRLTPENAGLRLVFAYTDQRANEPFSVPAGQESPVTVLTEVPSAPRSFELSTVFVAD